MSTTTLNNEETLSHTIYPNPAEKELNIRSTTNNVRVRVIDLMGRTVIETQSKKINVAELAKGCYLVELNSNGIIKNDRLIIK